MTKITRIAAIAVLIAAIVFLTAPVIAGTPNEEGTCIVPPDEYFVIDSPDNNGVPVHDGLQLGFTFEIPSTDTYPYSPGGYLGIQEFKLKQSHEEQIKIAMGKLYYCNSLNQHPYQPTIGIHTVDKTGVSEDPSESIYIKAHASPIFR